MSNKPFEIPVSNPIALCEACKASYEKKRKWQKFCGKKCKNKNAVKVYWSKWELVRRKS